MIVHVQVKICTPLLSLNVLPASTQTSEDTFMCSESAFGI